MVMNGSEVRIRPVANVSEWMYSVSDALLRLDREHPPYTLGEAVAELREYAEGTKSSHWERNQVRQNISSLRHEIAVQRDTLGKRQTTTLLPLIEGLAAVNDRADLIVALKIIENLWHSSRSIIDAFRDLCDEAKRPTVTSGTLRKLSAIVASQIGPAANGSFSVLRRAAEALVSCDGDLVWMRNLPNSGHFSEPQRLEMAEQDLLRSPVGHTVVWFSYHRAILRGMRSVLGSITFLDARWALPNALGNGSMYFPERLNSRRSGEMQAGLKTFTLKRRMSIDESCLYALISGIVNSRVRMKTRVVSSKQFLVLLSKLVAPRGRIPVPSRCFSTVRCVTPHSLRNGEASPSPITLGWAQLQKC
jgi:hypothetical protein